jgi:hypothetical protein
MAKFSLKVKYLKKIHSCPLIGATPISTEQC